MKIINKQSSSLKKTKTMPNHIALRLTPDTIEVAGDFTTNCLNNLQIEVRALNADYTPSAHDTAEIANNKLLQHNHFANLYSVATAILEIPTEAIIGNKASVRITLVKSGIEILDIASYGMDFNTGPLPQQNTTAYQEARINTYITIPSSSPTLFPDDMIGLPSGSIAPSFDLLNNAVTNALSGGMVIENLSFEQCQTIASSILLPSQMNPMPIPSTNPVSIAPLEDMYTAVAGLDYSQDRNAYESLRGNPSVTQANIDKMARFVFSLSAAHHCANESASATKVRFRFPARPEAVTNNASITEMELVLQNSPIGVFSPSFAVPVEYYYANTANLPESITPAQRCISTHGTSRTTLIQRFQQANADGVITIGDLSINENQAARRLDAYNSPVGGIPICEIPSSGPKFDLIQAWLDDLQSDDDVFWSNNIANHREAHLELVICNLTEGYTLLPPTNPPINASSAEELEGKSEFNWADLFDGYTSPAPIPLNIQLFLTNVKKYFSITGSQQPISAPFSPEPAAQSSGDSIQRFIECYNKEVGAGNEFNFSGAWDNTIFQNCLNELFPGDSCFQNKLREKLNTIKELQTLVEDCDAELQFTIMESLWVRGFTDAASIKKLLFPTFKEALVGTIAYDCALEIYEKVEDDSEEVEPIEREFFVPINNGKLVHCIPFKWNAPLSPVGYLNDLLHLHENATCDDPRGATEGAIFNDVMKATRGDIGSLETTHNNLCVPIPMIDLAIESMENIVENNNTPTGVIHNTSSGEIHGHKLLKNGSSVQPEGEDIPFYHDPTTLLEAMPEHSSPTIYSTAYDKLKKDFSNLCCLPYNQPLDVSRTYLKAFGVSRFDKMKSFRKAVTEFVFDQENPPELFPSYQLRYPLKTEIAIEYLGISQEEYDCFYTKNITKKSGANKVSIFEIFGYPDSSLTGADLNNYINDVFIPEVSNLCVFLKRMCLNYCQFLDLVNSGFLELISDDEDNGYKFPEHEPCDCSGYKIGILTEESFSDLNFNQIRKLVVFIKLWHQLQKVDGAEYSFSELRDICNVLDMFNGANINPDFIRKLASFQILKDEFNLSLTDGTTDPLWVDENRTHLLSLWVGSSAAKWDWAVDHLLDQIQVEHESGEACRSPEFVKILKENLNDLSILAGFDPNETTQTWHACPTHTLKFAEVLRKIGFSNYTVGEILFLFTVKEQLPGDDPLPQQTRNEAIEFPFDLPDNNEEFSLWKLREKLLEIEGESITDEEIAQWNWLSIDSKIKEKFGYNPGGGTDYFTSLGTHFFPNILSAEGYSITNNDKQYRTALPSGSTAPSMWQTPANGPFKYDPSAQELFSDIALTDEDVIEKLSRIRQLKPNEIEAVQKLYFMPRLELARFGFIFSNFTEAQEKLIQEPDENLRWKYFVTEFIKCYKKSNIIAVHLAEHVISVTGQESEEGKDSAWLILRHLLDSENKANTSWEADSGEVPEVCWKPQPNGGAFSSLLGLTGTGLQGTFTTEGNGTPTWVEIRGGLSAFGSEENRADVPIPTVIPQMDFSLSQSQNLATIKNGFAVKNSDGELLGGAQGYDYCWEGILMVENSGKYKFQAGAPSPGNEIPDFEKAKHAKWLVELKRGQTTIKVLSHQIDGETAPADCSTPVKLKRGAYNITIKYTQTQPDFQTYEDGCPQTTGFQIKWNGPDTNNELEEIGIEHLYLEKKEGKLVDLIKEVDDINTEPIACQFLWHQHYGSIRGIRGTYIRAFEALLFAHRFQLSAQPISDNMQSELGYFLSQPERFAGYAYYQNGTDWTIHNAHFNFNLLPLRDNYCTPDSSDDIRVEPTIPRIQALFDWWLRMCEYVQLRKKTANASESPVWLIFHESNEMHSGIPEDLLRHMGIDISHSPIVTKFYEDYTVTSSDLKDERWAIRVCEAAMCLEKLLCNFCPKDISKARPDLWVSNSPQIQPEGSESGNENLMEFIHDGLIENGESRKYDLLKNINDCLRKNAHNALVCYLTSKNRIAFPVETFPDETAQPPRYVSEVRDLSEFLNMDIEAGICQKASRFEEAITSIQLFVHQSRLGLKSIFSPSADFIHLWEKKMMSYQTWEMCKRRDLYSENYVEYIEFEEARKSESFRHLVHQLDNNNLTIPVSGGNAILKSNQPPNHSGLAFSQETHPTSIVKVNPEIEGFDVMATPENISPSWLSSTEFYVDKSGENLAGKKLPFWLKAAINLGLPFIRTVGALSPSGVLTYDCHSSGEGCCKVCGKTHPAMIDEYYFWLIDGRYYERVTQDANWDGWTEPEANPSLEDILHMNSKPLVYLVWTRVHNGEFQQMRWSSKGVSIDGFNLQDSPYGLNYGLQFGGRIADTFIFTVTGEPNSNTVGFRYNLVANDAVVYPDTGLSAITPSAGFGGLVAAPTFILFEPGAPVQPISLFSPIQTIAKNLRTLCNYEGALNYYELNLIPLQSNNFWEDANDNRKSMLFHYLETLLEWGDSLMKKHTPESFQQARLIFDTARKILGKCPPTIYQKKESKESVLQFKPKNTVVNSRLLCLYENVEDKIQLIHNCLNAYRLKNGKPEKDMPYWGNSIFSKCGETTFDKCVEEHTWCLPNENPYRFEYLINRAIELAGLTSNLGNALLTALEKCDNEILSNLRAANEKQIFELGLSIRQNQLRSSDFEVQGLQKALLIAEMRKLYYQSLIDGFPIPKEVEYEENMWISLGASLAAQLSEGKAQESNGTPDEWTGTPIPTTLIQVPGVGNKGGSVFSAAARISNMIASAAATLASLNLTKAGWIYRMKEWVHQVAVLTEEIEQIRRQLRAAERRREASLGELNSYQRQIEYSKDVLDFLNDKFTSQELYLWMKGRLTNLHSEMFNCALHTARQAQIKFNKERGYRNKNFLNAISWDTLHQGLLSGDVLQNSLRQMQKAYVDDNTREYEITKHFSLKKHFPQAFLNLRETGACEFEIGEYLYDLDNPGHYMRRIKSVSISIPCVSGPFTNLSGRLTLVSSKTRVSPQLSCSNKSCNTKQHPYHVSNNDSRFVYEYANKEAIATSNGQNDSGLFELNFRDERLLPFEYYGAISCWRLEVPKENNYFDHSSITDAVVHVNFMAREGGELLRKAAREANLNRLPDDGKRIFEVKKEFPEEWHLFENGKACDDKKPKEMLIKINRNHFCYLPYLNQIGVHQIEVFFESCERLDCKACEVGFLLNPKDRDEHPDKCEIVPINCFQRNNSCLYHGMVNLHKIEISDKEPTELGVLIFPDEIDCLENMFILVHYKAERLEEKCEIFTIRKSTIGCH